MLAIVAKDDTQTPLYCEDYCIVHNWNGWDDIIRFTLPRGHPQVRLLAERVRLAETTEKQLYALTSINTGKNSIAYEAKLDLDELCGGKAPLENWNNYVSTGLFSKGPQTMAETIYRAISELDNWRIITGNITTEKLAIEGFNGTTLELIQKVVDIWKNYPVRFSVPTDPTSERIVHIYDPGAYRLLGAYFTEELNLLEQPSFKGKADTGDSYYTALRLVGNGCRVDVENHDYDARMIWHYESDTSISDATALKVKADAMVKAASAPKRSYSCKIADLYRLRPEKYQHLRFSLYDKVILMDRDRRTNSTVQIAQYTVYPYHPENNAVQLNSVAGTITSTSKNFSGNVIQYDDPQQTQEA